MVIDSRKCTKQHILIKLWLAQPKGNSSNVNELEHDGEYSVTANESDTNMNVSAILLTKTLTAQTKWMEKNSERRKSPNQSLFKVICVQTERNNFTYKCASCRVMKEKL